MNVRLVNGLCFLLSGSLLVFAVIDAVRGSFREVALDLAGTALLFLPVLLNRSGRPRAARFALLTLANAGCLVNAWVLGSGSGVPFLYVGIATLACAVIDPGERRLLAAWLAITISCFLVSTRFPELGSAGTGLPFRAALMPLNGLFLIGAVSAIVLYFNAQNRRQHAQAARSAKFAALGQLAAGFAHEINNPLAIIKGRASMLEMILDDEKPDVAELRRVAKSIDETSDRVAAVIKGVLAFARAPERIERKPIDLDAVIASTCDICRETLSQRGIALSVGGATGVVASGDQGYVQQALVNLIGNARDAIVTAEASTEHAVKVVVERHGDDVVVDVTDSGPGIPDTIADRVMEPFFTTKAVGSGTGLGLSLSKGLLEVMGGGLEVVSRRRPTTFRIRLPAHRA